MPSTSQTQQPRRGRAPARAPEDAEHGARSGRAAVESVVSDAVPSTSALDQGADAPDVKTSSRSEWLADRRRRGPGAPRPRRPGCRPPVSGSSPVDACEEIPWRPTPTTGGGIPAGPRGIHPSTSGEDDVSGGTPERVRAGRRGVGVDIEDLTGHVEVGCDGGHSLGSDRPEDVEDGGGVDGRRHRRGRLVDGCTVDLHGSCGAHRRGRRPTGEAGTASGPLADKPDEFAADLPGQHHPHDIR